MPDVRNSDALWIFLVTSLTRILCVPAWPSAQTRAYFIPRVLSCMDNLRSITLPSFDLHIVRHCSAFGLHHIEFGNTRLSGSLSSSHGSMARLMSSPSVSRSCSMTMTTRHRLRHFPPDLRVPAFSPCPPCHANHSRPDEHCLSPISITPQ